MGPWLCHFAALCASPYSLWALLQPIPTPAALPDTNIIPLRCAEASSSGHGACLTSRFFLFHRGGKHFLARLCSKINTRLTAIWCTALEISDGKYHPQPGLRLPANRAAEGSNNQSGPGPAQHQTSGPRPNWGD